MGPLLLLRSGCLLLAAGCAAGAQEAPFTFRGFGTLGVVRSSTDEAEFIRDVAQPKGARRSPDAGLDSRLGLQANLRLGEDWEAVVQAVASRRFDDTFTPDLTWAFVKWQAAEGLEARAGRLGFDVYLLADTRNVGYSYLWVRPPAEYFGGIPITSFEGADLVLRRPLAGGFGSLKLFGGHAVGRIPSLGTETFDLKGSPLMGLHGDLRTGDWGIRLAWAQLRFRQEFNSQVDALLTTLRDPAVAALSPTTPALADELAVTDKWVRYLSLGLSHEQGPLQAQLALSRITSQTPALPTGHAGYLLVGYRMGAWTPYLSLAAAKTAGEQRSTGLPAVPFAGLDQGIARILNINQNRQRALSLGLRWDFHRNLCLKAQVDALRNQDHATQLWWRSQPSWDGRATVASLTLDFVF